MVLKLKPKSIIPILCVLLGFAATSFGAAPIHLRVIWTENPQTRATISWSTNGSAASNTVFYDTKSHGTDTKKYAKKTAAQVNGKYSTGDTLHYHHATITKLTPATTYYFVVQSGGSNSKMIHFRTAPNKDVDFSILHGGDSRSGHDARQQVNKMIGTMTDAIPSLIAFAHGGDFVSSGKRLDQWDKWLTHHQLTISAKGRILPIIPARGNHEASGPLYDEVFAKPGGGIGKNFFQTYLSPKVLLVTLNSETSVEGNQKQFLEATLKKSGSARWRVAQYHRPAYPAVKSPGRTKRWVPLFEKYGVQLACEADGHNIKRTPPIRNDKVDPTGVVYVGEGGLGVGQRTPKTDRWYLKPPGKTGRGHHVMVLKFTSKSLTISTHLLGGKLFDRYVINAR